MAAREYCIVADIVCCFFEDGYMVLKSYSNKRTVSKE